MSQFYIVCRKRTNGSKCSMAISADTKEDLLTAAIEHAVSIHSLQDTRGLRDEYRVWVKKGTPPA